MGVKVAIDTTGSMRAGIGHLVRSVTLAHRLRHLNGDIRFIATPHALPAFIARQMHEMQSQASWNDAECPDVVVVDRPDTSSSTLRRLHRRWPDAALVALDYYDTPVEGLAAVINLNLARERRRGDTAPFHCRGLRYAVVRESFRSQRRQCLHTRARARQILVAFGGTDPHAWSMRVAAVLHERLSHDVAIRVIAGRGQPGLCDHVPAGANVMRHEGVQDPAPLMRQSDLAVIGGGTMLIEAACVGVPALVIPRTREERVFAEYFARLGAAKVLPSEPDFSDAALYRYVNRMLADVEMRRKMRVAGRSLVDGRGGDRVAKIVMQMAGTGR